MRSSFGSSLTFALLVAFSAAALGQASGITDLGSLNGGGRKLGAGIASVMANATTQGAVPSYWLNLSYQVTL